MICTEPLRDISSKEAKAGRYYSACGFSDWKIGNWHEFFHEHCRIYSEMAYYLGKTIPIYENDLFYWQWLPGLYASSHHWKYSSETEYLDGKKGVYYYPRTDYKNMRKSGKANALLVRKIK